MRVLTGITTSGIPHLGNYVGAIAPAIYQTNASAAQSFFFLADYHALIKCHNPKAVTDATRAIAATWLACGLDPDKSVFYRQSDVPECTELAWILSCVCAKGLMNRAHAYKAMVGANSAQDPDDGISMGLFSYPILMAADILLFNATHIPVGRDQIQHIEMARDMAGAFNHRYKPLFVLPQAVVDDSIPLLTGLDGRKMSKSYGNTIPLFGDNFAHSEAALKKAISRIVTNSQAPHEPKDPSQCTIFEIYCAFATSQEIAQLRTRYQEGIGWGEAKQILFERVNAHLGPMRSRYFELMDDPKTLEETLTRGAHRARQFASGHLDKIRRATGIKPLAHLK